MKIVFILLVILLPLLSLAQQSDSQLAYTYYQNKDYEKAAQLFLQLYERTHASNFLDYHIFCLINGKQYDQAEEVLKKFLKTDNRNKDYLVNLGYIYEQQGKSKKAEEYYEKAIKTLIPHSSDINSLAYKFRNIRQYGWAIKTYRQGQILLKKMDAFLIELGDNYMMERNYEEMIDIFIRYLKSKPSEINNITSKLSFARNYDLINSVDAVIEKKLTELMKQADYPPVFDELAVWHTLQKQEYAKAFQHAVKLDRKAENKLYIFLNIAQNAYQASHYQIAEEAWKKILEKGKEKNSYYATAYKETLECRYQRCLQEHASPESYQKIAQEGEKYMQEYSYTSNNVGLVLLLSDLYAYQLHSPQEADKILTKGIQIPRLSVSTLNVLKSRRADILAFMNNPWEATILYTQIEKSNPNNDIGYEAKLKKAWLAYYVGDLLWAKAQFDVLKGATSKLIANDALKMAHFIDMNYEKEGNNQDLEKLARTEYLIYKQQTDIALPVLDSLVANSNRIIADRAALQKAAVLINLLQYEKACALLENLKDKTDQTHIKAEAIYKLADVKIKMNAIQEARELYKLLVSQYSGSVYSIEARKRFRELKTEN